MIYGEETGLVEKGRCGVAYLGELMNVYKTFGKVSRRWSQKG